MPQHATALIDEATVARRDARPDDARRLLLEALALCRRGEAPRELVRALKAVGQIERDLGNTEAACAHYEEAVAHCRRDGPPHALAHALRHLGDVHREAGRPERAEPCLREALALCRADERTPPLELANALRPLALLAEARGTSAEARRHWDEARALYADAGVDDGVAECAAHLDRLRGRA